MGSMWARQVVFSITENCRDRAIVNHITEKISKVQKQRQGLKNEEKRILSKMQQKSSKKKLAIF